MIVNVNMSRDVYDYFKDYNLSDVANTLLQQYDFTILPQTSGIRDVERKVNITDPIYIRLYNIVGPRSKKVSLGRLFEFAYSVDVLNIPGFKVEPTKGDDNVVKTLVDRAYKALLEAQKYSKDDEMLTHLTHLVRNYKEVML